VIQSRSTEQRLAIARQQALMAELSLAEKQWSDSHSTALKDISSLNQELTQAHDDLLALQTTVQEVAKTDNAEWERVDAEYKMVVQHAKDLEKELHVRSMELEIAQRNNEQLQSDIHELQQRMEDESAIMQQQVELVI